MKRLFVLFFVLLACAAHSQGIPSPSTPRLMADDAGNSVSQSYPLPVSIGGSDSANIASMALDINNVASNAAILPNIDANIASIAIDTNNVASNAALLPNIDANTAIMSDALSNPLEWKVSVASVTSTISTFTSQLTSDTRRFVAIKNRDAFKPVYLGFEDVVTVETGLPINDTLYIEAPKDVPLYFISAEEVGIVLMEGGR